MGKFQDLIDKRGYKIEPVKTVRVPTIEEYNEKKRQEQNTTADVVDSLGTAQTAFTGGLLAGLPGIRAATMKPTIQANDPLRRAPVLGESTLTVGTDQQVFDRRLDKAGRDIEELEDQYAAAEQKVAQYSQSSAPEDWEKLQAAQEEANGLLEQLSETRAVYGELQWDANNRVIFEADMKEVANWSPDEIAAVQKFYTTRKSSDFPKSLADRYDPDRLEELLESYELAYNQMRSQEAAAAGEELGEKLGILGVVPQVGGGILGTAGNLLGIFSSGGSEAKNGTGRYKGPDPYRSSTWVSDWASGVGKGAAKKTPEQMLNLLELMGNANPYSSEMASFNATPNNYTPQLYEASRGTKAGDVIDAVGAGAYQVVNTAADSVARAYLGGAIFGPGTSGAKAFSLGLAGARSYSDTFNGTLRKGGTPGQAALLGVFNAGTEVATEYIPLDEWWKVAEKGVDGVVPMLKQAARQGAIEMTQEEIGFLATTFMEYAVLREKSEYQVLKRELMAQGYSEEQAERMMWEEFGRQAAGVAATSFFSGGLSEVGAAAWHSLMPGAVTTQQGTAPESAAPQSPAETAPTTQGAREQADVPVAETVSQEKTPLEKAQDYYRQNGTVSNSLAREILADSASLDILTEQADLQLGHTDSQRRNDVKAAVARLTGTAETSKTAGADLAEGIASDIAESQAETQQTAQETEQRGDVDEAIGSALRGEQPKVQTVAQTQQQTAPAAQEVQEQGQTAETAQTEQQGQPQQTDMEHGAVGAANAGFTKDFAPEMADSNVYTNTYANATDPGVKASGEAAMKEDPQVERYEVRTEKDSLSAAQARTKTDEDVQAEYEILMREPQWSGEDNDTAMIVLKRLFENGEIDKHRNLSRKQREQATNAGQLVQSFAKYSRMDAMTAASEGLSMLQSLGKDDVDKRYWGKADGKTDKEKFSNWVKGIAKKMAEIGKTIDGVEDGDIDSMRQIVRELAQFRRTTAWFGISNNLTRAADKGINRLDFETLRTVAKAQLGQIPNDYKKVSVGQVIKSISIMNMLSSLVTVNRNIVGNASTGLMDAFSDSGAGRLADYVLSKVTGIRTVGDDIRHSKEYFKGAWDAACMASLVTELAIPMDNAAYTDPTRTFSPQGNLMTRFLSGLDMGMKYALEVTDKFFEGGAQASVTASLKDMGTKSGLTETQTETVARATGERRTYKDDRKLAKATSTIKAGLNEFDIEDVGVGDVFMPFAKVPANVVHVGIDYSAGIVEGLGQMIKVAKAAKAGKKIDPMTQRAAATNFGRGVSGAVMIAMFTALAAKGAIKVFDDDDRDKASLEQSLGYDDAVWNLSASLRLLTGKDGAWKPDDIKINLGFLQPFNSQMYIAAELAKEDSFWDMVKAIPGATVSGIANSIMDIPMFQTFEDVVDIAKSFGEVGEDPEAVMDATGKLVGNVATRAIPSWLRQTAQYIDPYYRDTGGEDAMEKAGKQFLSAIPGASKLLPKKYDGLGNPQMRYTDPVLGFFNTFVSPGKITGATAPEAAYDIVEYLGELEAATDKKTMYPDYKAPTEFTWDGDTVELSKEQQTEYQRVYGENIADMYTQFMASETFRSFPAEIQLSILQDAKTMADDLAKAYITGNGSGKPEDLGETVNGLMRGEVGSVLSKGASWYLDGNTEKGMEQIANAVTIYDSMNAKGKEAMLGEVGGRAKYLLLAHDEGMDPEKFLKLYEQYSALDDNKLMNATGKTEAWGLYLQRKRASGEITRGQELVLRKNMLFFSNTPGSSKKLDEMQGANLGADTIEAVLGGIDLLEPLPGNSGVTDYQVRERVMQIAEDENLSDREIDIVMKTYMTDYNPNSKNPDKTELKYDEIRGRGYTPGEYFDLYEIYVTQDRIGGKGTKKRTIEMFEDYLVDSGTKKRDAEKQAELLYSILSGDYY